MIPVGIHDPPSFPSAQGLFGFIVELWCFGRAVVRLHGEAVCQEQKDAQGVGVDPGTLAVEEFVVLYAWSACISTVYTHKDHTSRRIPVTIR